MTCRDAPSPPKERAQVEPGDRFVSEDGKTLCVAPYRHTFVAPVKGRWIGLPLLTAFTREFASVHDAGSELPLGNPGAPAQEEESGMVRDATNAVAQDSDSLAVGHSSKRQRGDDDVFVSLDKFDNMLEYARKLKQGDLWIKGREAECLAAGRQYLAEFEAKHLLNRATKPLDEEVRLILDELPPLVVLKQNNVIQHCVVRHEGRLSFDRPLALLSMSLAGAGGQELHVPTPSHVRGKCVGPADTEPVAVVAPSTSFQLRHQPQLLFVDKPCGMPVHPSGKFRKNSVTMILEDIFGGNDAHRYFVEEIQSADGARSANVRHKKHGFVMVVLAPTLSREAYDVLVGMHRGTAPPLRLFVVHRLDVATSGVLMFGLDSDSARRATGLLAEKTAAVNRACLVADPRSVDWSALVFGAEKRYVARVRGNFDDVMARSDLPMFQTRDGASWAVVSMPIYCESYFNSVYACPAADDLETVRKWLAETAAQFDAAANNGGSLLLSTMTKDAPGASDPVQRKREAMRRCAASHRAPNAPRGDLSPDGENGIRAKYPELRSAVSAFRPIRRLLSTPECESLVECIPITGRTHQLRVHLAYLGHPISNDAKYSQQRLASTKPTSTQLSSAVDEVCLHARSYELVFRNASESIALGASVVLPSWASVKADS